MRTFEHSPALHNAHRAGVGAVFAPERVAPGATTPSQTALPPLSIGGVALLAVVLRLLLVTQQSAYMDETSNILTGRYLIESGREYAGALSWAYGSYLWPVITGAAALVGGLTLVRGVTALLSAIMVVMTALAALKLAPRKLPQNRRTTVAIIAGLIMALFPTAIAGGRFATYDSLAAAAFMTAVVLLIPRDTTPRRWYVLLGAAALFFVGFLAKYIIAVFFPFICLYLICAPRSFRGGLRNITIFVAPLAIACAAYFAAYSKPLLSLLSFSTGYHDLASPNPAQEYVWQRPEIWLLAGVALFGLRRATGYGRAVAGSIVAIFVAFQVFSRADYDFWKHSVYFIFALAPLAALALAPLVQRIMTRRGVALVTALALVAATVASMVEANLLVTFYPNLNPSLDAIARYTANAKNVLTDDSAARLYLYPHISTDRITDPFYVDYNGLHGEAGYRQAMTDRYYDAIILDGGVGPASRQITDDLGDVLQHYYRPVYTAASGHGAQVEIYQPRPGTIAPLPVTPPAADGTITYTFDSSLRGWGGHGTGDLQPGFQTTLNHDQTWQGHSTLQFTSGPQASLVGVKRIGPIHRITAQVYIVGARGGYTPVGMVGFDVNWNWHDDGFKQVIPAGQWTTLTWSLDTPGVYNEIGLKFSDTTAQTVYIGQVTITP